MTKKPKHSSQFAVGILSTIDSPLLPFYISAARSYGVTNIVVLCDSKLISQKDKIIWNDRTGKTFTSGKNSNINIYVFARDRIPFYFVDDHNGKDCIELILALKLKCLLNAGTPRKISKQLIDIMENGVLNIHPGILPKYRGCSAVEWAIFNNDKVGNTAHFMDEGYDTGPIIESECYEFPSGADYQSIRVKVHQKGCDFAGRVLSLIQKKGIKPNDAMKQLETDAKYWNPIPSDKMETVLNKINSSDYPYLHS